MTNLDSTITSQEINFRGTSVDDRELIFKWRNLREIIALSSSKLPVSWEEHARWFSSITSEYGKLILIIEEKATPIGQVSFTLSDENIASISIYLEPNSTGRGLGAYLIKEACIRAKEKWGSNIKINAEILVENIRSTKAFKKAGFNIAALNNGRNKNKECITLTYAD